MPRIIDADDERYHDVLDDHGLVRDGKIVRVSLMDGLRARGQAPPVDPDPDDEDDEQDEDEEETTTHRRNDGFVTDSRPGGPWAPRDRRLGLSDAELRHARQRLQDEYAKYDQEAANAWRSPPNGPDPSNEYTGSQPLNTGYGAPGRGANRIPEGAYPMSAGEGSQCTIDGRPGTLVRQGNWLICKPSRSGDAMPSVGDARFMVSDEAKRAREQAYADAEASDANAWRTAK